MGISPKVPALPGSITAISKGAAGRLPLPGPAPTPAGPMPPTHSPIKPPPPPTDMFDVPPEPKSEYKPPEPKSEPKFKPEPSSSGSGSVKDEDDDLIDWGAKQCLLCRRAFNSIDQLTKHVKKSKLHKENLAKLDKHAEPEPEPESEAYKGRGGKLALFQFAGLKIFRCYKNVHY